MEISPIQIFFLILSSLAFGVVCGVVNDVNRTVRVLFGVKYLSGRFDRLYKIKLPIIRRSLGEIKESRLKRVLLPTVIFLQDVFLFLFAGCGVAVINYYFNSGRIRIYTPIAVLCGFLAYYFTVGKLVLYFSELLAFIIRAFFAVIFEMLLYPFKIIVVFLLKMAKKLLYFINKTLAKRQKLVYNRNKMKYVLQEADLGFFRNAKK